VVAAQQRGLGDLDDERGRGQAGVIEGAFERGEEGRVAQLPGRDVDAEDEVAGRRLAHAHRLGAGLPEHPGAEGVDQARLLGDRHELVGPDRPEVGMRPAQQRLQAVDLLGGERGDRLGHQVELAAVQRAAQRGLDLQPTGGAVAVLVAAAVPVAALVLGHVHGLVGAPDRLVGVDLAAGDHAQPDARGGRQAVGAAGGGRGDRGDDALGDDRRAIGLEVLGHDDELVAAEAGDRVAGPDGAGDALGDVAQHLVADVVPERVVDKLQPVQVDEEHRQRRPGPPRPRERVRQPVEQQRPVRQPGQRVVRRPVDQLLGRTPALDRDPRQLRRVAQEAPVLLGWLTRLAPVDPEGPQHVPRPAEDRERPAMAQAVLPGQRQERRPPRIGLQVGADHLGTVMGRRAAGPDVGPDDQPVELGHVGGGQRRRRAVVDGPQNRVQQQHRALQPRVEVLDAQHHFAQHVGQRRVGGDQRVDAVMGGHDAIGPLEVAGRDPQRDLRGDRVGDVAEQLHVARRPRARVVLGNTERSDGLTVDANRRSRVGAQPQLAWAREVVQFRVLADVLHRQRRPAGDHVLADPQLRPHRAARGVGRQADRALEVLAPVVEERDERHRRAQRAGGQPRPAVKGLLGRGVQEPGAVQHFEPVRVPQDGGEALGQEAFRVVRHRSLVHRPGLPAWASRDRGRSTRGRECSARLTDGSRQTGPHAAAQAGDRLGLGLDVGRRAEPL
jgi:hypothetical protein